jgi:hypothetical protein
MAGVPGGSTGLVIRHFRGRNRVPVYKVDIQLVQELRLILRQAAEETGDICPAGRPRRQSASSDVGRAMLSEGMMRFEAGRLMFECPANREL